jgi:hypothetical protein
MPESESLVRGAAVEELLSFANVYLRLLRVLRWGIERRSR